jgi:tripartite-type tricarboxylate transporter receptor subunit TctC
LWSGVFAPIATPPAIVTLLQRKLTMAIGDPGVAVKLQALAVGPGVATPEEFKQQIESEITKYKDVIKSANLHFT